MEGSRQLRQRARPAARQRGAVLVLFVVGMVAILAMAGLALDGSHLMLNKTRLQNTVDAAALAGAKTLDETGNETAARTSALALFGANAQALGNRELRDSYNGGTTNVVVEFSNTLNPFAPGTSPAMYVRVRATNFRMPAWLIPVVSGVVKAVAASAVAGPSPTILQACNLVPLVVCGTPPSQGGTAPFWGFDPGQPEVLKTAAGQQSPIGPGNFQLVRLGGSGASVLRHNLAGGYEGCFDDDDAIPTEPGNDVGPVFQGINTRLNIYAGPLRGSREDYPPDVVTQQPNPRLTYDDATGEIRQGGTVITDSSQLDFNYSTYQSRVSAPSYDVPPAPGGAGAFDRRNMAIPIADCTGVNNGQTDLPLLGFGCFFLLQEAVQQGNKANLFGEFVSECDAAGNPGPDPTNIPGPYIIQLYRNFDSIDS